MQIKFEDDRPIFIQIAEGIEDSILSGAFPEESQIPSITEFSVNYKINPATALKGINLLVDQEIVYKKRGVGMFVAEGAVRKLRQKRKDTFYQDYIEAMIAEARRLELSAAEIKEMIEKGFEDIV
ncbi:GntR family transcriptional regulator [Lachnotalea sp. AF33-28]|uniref:GntR family transcriptional regulator n=1 Tax=Lachnotalea sp. AF33-28 TaxID=2292046 RepID=UPI000E54FB32|nr:GntR family transcriptional regulator [Lachnotalea sp. AF33-28]RHP33662.1 GntR family transcriptional regulator [Lachnotalea sp. AF33-28]